MPNYKLEILFNKKDMEAIFDAGQKVVLLKKVSAGIPVTWTTFQPFEKNYVSWKDAYAIYASTTEVKSGVIIDKLCEISATPKQLYKFSKGTFGHQNSVSNAQEGQYVVTHKMEENDLMVFGLAQEVECNGVLIPGSPINAAIVPVNQTAKFTPYEIITVFLEVNTNSGTVYKNVFSRSIDVAFGASVTEITIQYDSCMGSFMRIGKH